MACSRTLNETARTRSGMLRGAKLDLKLRVCGRVTVIVRVLIMNVGNDRTGEPAAKTNGTRN
jgi:hypothetical protein